MTRFLAVVVAMLLAPPAAYSAAPDKIIADERSDRVVTVRDVAAHQGTVSGVLVNRSHKQLRDVRLLIHHNWLWANEQKPGDDSPGRVAYYTVRTRVPPEGDVSFTYRAEPPLPERDDGRFETTVEIVGWTEIGQ